MVSRLVKPGSMLHNILISLMSIKINNQLVMHLRSPMRKFCFWYEKFSRFLLQVESKLLQKEKPSKSLKVCI